MVNISPVDYKKRIPKKHYDKLPFPLMQPHYFCTVIGRRKSGKTMCVVRLILDYYKHAFDYIIVVSPTWKTDDTWQALGKLKELKEKVMFTDAIENETIINILERQKQLVMHDPKHSRLLLVIDDCGSSLRGKELRKAVNTCASTLRHFNASCFLMAQSILQLDGVQVTNSTQLLIYAQDQRAIRKISADLCFHKGQKWFEEFVTECTKEKYSFAFIDTEKDGDEMFRQNFETNCYVKK